MLADRFGLSHDRAVEAFIGPILANKEVIAVTSEPDGKPYIWVSRRPFVDRRDHGRGNVTFRYWDGREFTDS